MEINFKNRVVLVTGGTGSFGNAVVDRLLSEEVSEIRVFSRDEKKQEEMRLNYCDDRLKFYIGDVRSYDSIDMAMQDVNFVFHAAALKQVPSCEFYPMEAVNTNIMGADNVMKSAVANSVDRCVVLSTDKAVYPINAMGISKAMMEKLMVARSRNSLNKKTVLCATRYGNVMGSRGSVIPLMVDQARRNRPLTLTDPNMTRFLMSLEESVDLVLHAFQHAASGDIYVQKSPSSTVGDLAKAVKEIFSSSLQEEIIGTRHGEKLYETLVSREEMTRAIDQGKFYKIPPDNRDLNYNKFFVEGDISLSNSDDYTSHNTNRLSVFQIKETLLKSNFVRNVLDE